MENSSFNKNSQPSVASSKALEVSRWKHVKGKELITRGDPVIAGSMTDEPVATTRSLADRPSGRSGPRPRARNATSFAIVQAGVLEIRCSDLPNGPGSLQAIVQPVSW
ncbi:hypothetical protein GCM10010412_015700 [Nonomuraea recticatena]|uniref:Cyclic nucleotide-binding domain-containing protein n=1 Tax=Nonomuraea recticatena TaxID=46178 RepID=A0ABN3REF1_9ACTN